MVGDTARACYKVYNLVRFEQCEDERIRHTTLLGKVQAVVVHAVNLTLASPSPNPSKTELKPPFSITSKAT